MGMVERIARAICTSCGRDPNGTEGGPMPGALWLDEGEANWTAYEDHARAALAAIREMSDAALVEKAMSDDRS